MEYSQSHILVILILRPHGLTSDSLLIVQDTGAFCRQTLCNSDLAHYINQKFVSWGGDVRYPDAYRLSNR